MNQDVHDWDGEPSLAWYGHPPRHAPVAEAETDVSAVSEPDQELDVYGRLVMSALVFGGALLLARSRAFRAVTWRLTKFAITTWLPARLATEVRKAWRDAAAVERPETDVAGSR